MTQICSTTNTEILALVNKDVFNSIIMNLHQKLRTTKYEDGKELNNDDNELFDTHSSMMEDIFKTEVN
jgi:hypothetical protein